jgi:hypothetical protein
VAVLCSIGCVAGIDLCKNCGACCKEVFGFGMEVLN